MAPGSYACRSPCVNTAVDPAGELDELAGQGPARKSNVRRDEAPTSLEAPTPTLIPLTLENFFTKLMKVFMETTQAREQLEPQNRPLKAKIPETHSGKSQMDCYYFCQ